MSTTQIQDYLRRQLTVEKNVITFRLLSRAASIHVNTAKTELATFLEQTRSPDWPEGEPVHAIYFLSGEMPAENMYAPMEEEGYKPPVIIRKVTHQRILLVPEEGLDEMKKSFVRVCSVHVHSLAPGKGPIQDIAPLNDAAETVRAADVKKKHEEIYKLGSVPSAAVKYDPKYKHDWQKEAVQRGNMVPKRNSDLGKERKSELAQAKVDNKIRRKEEKVVEKAKAAKVAKAEQTEEEDVKPQITSDAKPSLVAKKASTTKPPAANAKPNPFNKAGSSTAAKNAKPTAKGGLDWSKAKTKAKDSTSEVKKQPAQVKRKLGEPGRRPSEALAASMAAAVASEGGSSRRTSVAPSVASDATSDASELPPPSRKPSEAPSRHSSAVPSRNGSEASREKASVLLSEEDEAPKATRIKKRRLISDDEDDGPTPAKASTEGKAPQGKGKARVVDRGLRAMMDIDDEEVEHAPRPAPRLKKRKSSVVDDDVDMEENANSMDVDDKSNQNPKGPYDDETEEEEEIDPSLIDPEPAPTRAKPRKKVEKKVVPLGKNGLKKKKVMKSRMKTNERGYMVTEDYSSYESVSEEEEEEEEAEPQPEKKKKPAAIKAKEKPSAAAKPRPSASKSTSQETSKPKKAPQQSKEAGTVKKKPSIGGKAGQKDLMSFFGKG